MKGILVAAIIIAFVAAAVESLSCVQCNSLTNTCNNENITECPSDANSSCTSFMTNTSLGAANIYQDKACSAENCREGRDTVEAFTVHVSDNERFLFISQCCQGKECNDTTDALAPPMEDVSSDIECFACYGSNESSCNVQIRKCYKEERCVNLVAEFKNETKKLVLRGCSNISNSTCQFLSAENRTVGGVIFREFECLDGANFSSTAIPNSSLTTPPASSSNTTSVPTSTPDMASKVSFTPVAFVSLLLLGLLL
ncbi:ly6/PLAUR domain-containing protein 8 [Ursus americanus]|uniref:ly6/PLAUR domain-containing protein 8 n=1 Tax=Ursus americanus TaxID=9643 RepID=UPI001E67BBCF|nr:ly6/PLAUR domain-containing protein 8 [Ursus americanus]XP_057163235.1 ly6/PLAUR domain-containing protein 8 [Ursus arctos]